MAFLSGPTVLSFSSKSLLHNPIIVPFFGKMFNAFRVPKYYGPHRTSIWLRLGLLWPLGPGSLPNDDSEPCSLVHSFNNVPKSQSQLPGAKKSFFGLKHFNKALNTCALVANRSLQRALRT